MWSHPYSGCQLMPIPAMSSASLKFYLLSSLIFLCVISWSTGMSIRRPNSELTLEDREELYRQTPAVPDERLADAELDNAYELFKLRPRRPTENPNSRP